MNKQKPDPPARAPLAPITSKQTVAPGTCGPYAMKEEFVDPETGALVSGPNFYIVLPDGTTIAISASNSAEAAGILKECEDVLSAALHAAPQAAADQKRTQLPGQSTLANIRMRRHSTIDPNDPDGPAKEVVYSPVHSDGTIADVGDLIHTAIAKCEEAQRLREADKASQSTNVSVARARSRPHRP